MPVMIPYWDRGMNATPLANNSMPRCQGEEMTRYDPLHWDLH